MTGSSSLCLRIISPFSENVATKIRDRYGESLQERVFQTETLFSERIKDATIRKRDYYCFLSSQVAFNRDSLDFGYKVSFTVSHACFDSFIQQMKYEEN